MRRAIKLRVGRPDADPIYEVQPGEALPSEIGSQPQSEDLPASLLKNPELDSWIRINTDGTITLLSGKVELGQGIKTALAQIAAEELDVSLARIRVATGDTAQSPDEGLTVGSMSLETSGRCYPSGRCRSAPILLSIAYEELEAPLERLTVQDGTITDPTTGRSTTYWELFGGQRFGREISGVGQPKSPETYQIVGTSVKRLDLPEEVTGQPMYVHDLDFPSLLHARVVRPPHYAARLVSADIETTRHLPGVVRVVQDGSFLAVVAEHEEQAINALEILQRQHDLGRTA